MSKEYNKEQMGEIVKKIKELQLSYSDGAKEFNIPVRHIYRYNNELEKANGLSSDENLASKELDGSQINSDQGHGDR